MSNPIKERIDKINNLLSEQGRKHITFSNPVQAASIKNAQEALDVELPSSYVNFVTQYGTFTISGELTGNGRGNDTILFTPETMTSETERYRNEMADSDDEESIAILDDGLLFCCHPRDEYFFLFVTSSKREDGEMATSNYDYHDPANSTLWDPSEEFTTFEECMDSILDEVEACLEDE